MGLTERASRCRRGNGIMQWWSAFLHGIIEGGALKNSVLVTNKHQWVTDITRFFTGRDNVHCHKIWSGFLLTNQDHQVETR